MRERAMSNLGTQLEALEGKKATEVAPYQSREKIADFFKISEMFAKNLAKDRDGVATMLQQLEKSPSLGQPVAVTSAPTRAKPLAADPDGLEESLKERSQPKGLAVSQSTSITPPARPDRPLLRSNAQVFKPLNLDREYNAFLADRADK